MKAASTSKRRAISACFVPFYEDNPYQRELAKGLAAEGIEVSPRPWLRGMAAEWLRGGFRPAVLHLHWLPAIPPGLRGGVKAVAFAMRLWVLKALGTRVVWTVHNLYNHEAGSKDAERWVTRRVLGAASRVIVHGGSAVQLIEREFGAQPAGKVAVVPHGSYRGVYPEGVPGGEARARLGLRGDQRVMLFLGNIRPYKGVGELVDAFLAHEDPLARLVIAGRVKRPEDLALLEEKVGGDPRVMLRPGFVEDDQLQVYLGAADIVVFPYRDVLTSGAVVLAMSFGRACLAPRLGCIPDVLDEAGAILYDPDDPAGGLRAAVATAFEEAEGLGGMGSHNLAKAESWNWGRIGGLTAAVYREALGENHETTRVTGAANQQTYSNGTP